MIKYKLKFKKSHHLFIFLQNLFLKKAELKMITRYLYINQ